MATCCEDLTHWKDPNAGKDWRQEEKGMTEDEIVGCHRWLDRHEFEQAPGVGDGQGSLVCYSWWGRKESWDDWVTELKWSKPETKGQRLYNSTYMKYLGTDL